RCEAQGSDHREARRGARSPGAAGPARDPLPEVLRAEGAVIDRAERETRAIYAKADAMWARWSCPASAECCHLTKTQRQPWLWPSEWRLLTAKGPLPPARADGHCPFLDDAGRCTRYADRPLGCRTFFCE